MGVPLSRSVPNAWSADSAGTKEEVGVRGIPHSILIDPQGIVRFEGMPHLLSTYVDPTLHSHPGEAALQRLFAKYSDSPARN